LRKRNEHGSGHRILDFFFWKRAGIVERLTWIQAAAVILVFQIFAFGAPAFAVNSASPTFSKEVAPILFKHCANCHRPGEIGSAISLLSYERAQPWAKSIKEQVSQGKMPPWPADPKRSVKFRNDPRLTQKEIDTLIAWVDAGAPKGRDRDLPPPPTYPQGWLHPKGIAPDIVIAMPEFDVPAQGEIPYIRRLAKIPFNTDKWVTAMQVLPGNGAVVHHMALTEVELAPGVTPENIDNLQQVARKLGFANGLRSTHLAVNAPGNPAVHDMLGVYTPGTTFEMYGDDSAKLLKSGEHLYLNCNIHYQAIGQPVKDETKIAFWFRPDAPKHQLFRVPASGETIIAQGQQLLSDAPGEKAEGTNVAIPPIPPNAENYELIGITAYTDPITIYQLQPHAHLRGEDFEYAVVYPDGRKETLLTVPKYDFHWQLAYELETPLKLPAGGKLIVTAHYDNSAKNENLMHHHHGGDDGPQKEIHFREENQSWDEMFTPFIQYTIDDQDLSKAASAPAATGGPLPIAEVVGCLEQAKSGAWIVNRASEPVTSKTQGTSAAALTEAAARQLGSQQDELIGVDVFNPSIQAGKKVAAKGVLIRDGDAIRLNVTSLQPVGQGCS
jgi:mono/diheme cytochrome c family protein